MEPGIEEIDIEIGEQVTREVELAVDEERAWEAVSDSEMLERWLADESIVRLRPPARASSIWSPLAV